MLENLKMWIITVLIAAFIINLVDMILPSSKLNPYINLVINFIFVFIVITPIIGLFSKQSSLENSLLSLINKYNKEYIDSINNLNDKAKLNNMNKGYEEGMKEVLKLKLKEHGYELSDIEFNNSSIEKIKLKNSNNNETKSIESRENTKQVFSEKNNDLEKLKEGLVEILDISIETIEIDN